MNKQIIEEKIEQGLHQLAQSYNEFLVQSIPNKEAFFFRLKNKIQEESKYHSFLWYFEILKYTKPLSTFWEQLIFGRLYLMPILSGLFFIFSLSFFFLLKKEEISPLREEKINFGSTLPQPEEDKKDSYQINNIEEAEKQLLDKIQKEEDPEKKQKYIHELLEFYKQTNQTNKLKEIYNSFD